MKRIITILLVALASMSLSAQMTLKGIVRNEQDQGIEFASLQVLLLPDSSFLAGAISHKDGSFSIELKENYPLKNLLLRASCIGYTPLHSRINNPNHVLVSLREDDTLIKEVTISVQRTGQSIDKRRFSFSPKLLSSLQSSYELLHLLPDLRIDPRTDEIKSLTKGSAVILINGIEASPIEVKSLQVSSIKEVLYYNIPPARYAHAGVVVDIIAPKLNQGVDIKASTKSAMNASLVKSYAYIGLIRGKSKLSLDYSLSLQNNKRQEGSYKYIYPLLGQVYQHQTDVVEKSGHQSHTPTLRYAYSGETSTLQLSLANRFYSSHKQGDSRILDSSKSLEKGVGTTKENSTYWSPLIDSYYSYRLSPNRTLSLTAKYAYYNTEVDHLNTETNLSTSQLEVYDNMLLKNKTHSLGSEIIYSQTTSWGAWNSGYRLNYTRTAYDLDNPFGHQLYTTRKEQHYLYSELSGQLGSFSYQASLGLNLINDSYSEKPYRATTLSPRLVLSKDFNRGHSLTLSLATTSETAIAEMVSNNSTYLTRDIIDRGNPNLRRADYYLVRLQYSWVKPAFSIYLLPYMDYVDKPFYLDFAFNQGRGLYERHMRHAQSEISYGSVLQVEYKPFAHHLSLSAYLQPSWHRLRIADKDYTHNSLVGNFSATYIGNKWLVQYSYGLSDWQLAGGRLMNNFTSHDLLVRYTISNWGISAGWSIIGRPASYQMAFLNYSPVLYSSDTRIYDYKNMITLSLEYTLHKGKKHSVQRNIEGQVSNAVTF
ncbi:MAG: hypothetical protein SPK09_06755 [Porphyromonas sp.]|nr:hypothetical protein [Porphyromonas sp.]